MRLRDEIRVTFSGKDHLLVLLIINLSVFLVYSMSNLAMFLTGFGGGRQIIEYVGMPSHLDSLLSRPWTLFTYMFVHFDFFHILFNLLVLFWTGRILSDQLSQKKVTATYILGGLFGGVAFFLITNLIPALQSASGPTYLIGASAGVLSIMVASAMVAPEYPVHLLLFGEIKLKYVAIGLVVLYLISIPNGNSGGHIAHLGGALAGFSYIKLLRSGVNMGGWIEYLLGLPQKLSANRKIKVVHSNKQTTRVHSKSDNADQQAVIDSILDKISRSGYDSLSKSEKETLFKMSDENRNN
ncbi:MAG: rhomboid family intramembrane serine protease [Bacteroidota bacterium]